MKLGIIFLVKLDPAKWRFIEPPFQADLAHSISGLVQVEREEPADLTPRPATFVFQKHLQEAVDNSSDPRPPQVGEQTIAQGCNHLSHTSAYP